MSVIVKDMKMPNNCVDCEFGLYRFGVICQLRDYDRNVSQKYIDDDIRPDWCPLSKIIEKANDMSDENKRLFNRMCDGMKAMFELINNNREE